MLVLKVFLATEFLFPTDPAIFLIFPRLSPPTQLSVPHLFTLFNDFVTRKVFPCSFLMIRASCIKWKTARLAFRSAWPQHRYSPLYLLTYDYNPEDFFFIHSSWKKQLYLSFFIFLLYFKIQSISFQFKLKNKFNPSTFLHFITLF